MGHEERPKYVSTEMAREILGVSSSTFRLYAKRGHIRHIRTPGGHRRYHSTDVTTVKGGKYKKPSTDQTVPETKGAINTRVSSKKQEGDLDRRIKSLQQEYPDFEVFKDTCSGLNYKRKGLSRLLE